MIITYFGEQFFKMGQGDMVLAFNPVNKTAKSDISAHFGADIAFITTNYSLYNGVEQLSHGERMPFVINGPGDYEIKEVFIKGITQEPSRNIFGLQLAVGNVVMGVPEVAFNVKPELGAAQIGIGLILILAIANDAMATGREKSEGARS